MARVCFRLPGIHELTKTQREAMSLPLGGQYLIVGGPGTGKSVVALARARLDALKDNHVLLVYNKLLNSFGASLGGDIVTTKTWLSWFYKTFQIVYGQSVPQIKEYQPDWAFIETLNPEKPDNKTSSCHIIIDEGQDMPGGFYSTLIAIGYQNIFVVADQNQRIFQENSSRQQLENYLGIDPSDVIELTDNFRNNYPTARLAQHFFTNDPASPPVQLPPVTYGNTPRLISYQDGTNSIFDTILKQWDKNVEKLICVITPDNMIRDKFVAGLENTNPVLDHTKPQILTYTSKSNEIDIDFATGGIAVINQQSCKGLEFDMVYIADIDRFRANDTDALRKIFYVMCSRARERVFLLRSGQMSRMVEEILPTDETILERD